jgi:hypothetical protein
MRRTSRSLLLVALSAAGLLAAPLTSARADGDDGKPPEGEEGEKKGEDPHGDGMGAGGAGEKATMDGAIELGDAKRVVVMKVPKSWKTPDGFEPKGTRVAFFGGPLATNSPGNAVLDIDTTASRAALVLSAALAEGGTVQPEDARSGPGWVEGGVVVQSGRAPVAVWIRCIEKDGNVYVARVLCYAQARDEARPLVRQMLDTFRVAGTAPKAAPPADVKPAKAGEFDVWSDADKGKAAAAAELASEGRAALAKALKGKPFDESRPLCQAYQVGAHYVDRTKVAFGNAPDYAAFDPLTRSVLVQLFRSDSDDYPIRVQEAGARQYLVQYFGATPPAWIEQGLRWYGAVTAEAGGKPDKPGSARIDAAKQVIAATDRRLDQWMDNPPNGDGSHELFAWHWFLRHGPGRKYGKQYQASLDALRQSGDLAASRKAWDGVDFAAMLSEFKEWAAKWK